MICPPHSHPEPRYTYGAVEEGGGANPHGGVALWGTVEAGAQVVHSVVLVGALGTLLTCLIPGGELLRAGRAEDYHGIRQQST